MRKLFFHKGLFTIVQFTDLHWSGGGKPDLRSKALMEEIICAEKPDLVVFTGDLIHDKYCPDPRAAFLQAVSCAESAGIPWAFVFGNHDAEEKITRRELMELQATCTFSFSEAGPPEAAGVGNFLIPLYGALGRPAAALYFLDSGSYAPAPVGGYDWIRPSQVDWYVRNSAKLAACGGPLPSLAFFHIPLPEYKQVWDERTCCGVKYEEFDPPKINSGLFAAMLEQGDMLGTFAGHDHINDFCGELYGIRLCYGRGTGYGAYGKVGFARGARVIRLREGERSFETWLRLEGDAVQFAQPVHVPGASAAAASPEETGLPRRTAEERNTAEERSAVEERNTVEDLEAGFPEYRLDARVFGELLPGEMLEAEAIPAEWAERAVRFAPELLLVRNEPFALKHCVAVIHPEHPVIAYHLFWEDVWLSPAGNVPGDHQIVWIRCCPESGELAGIWSYFHGNIVGSADAATATRAGGNRPRVNVQWAIHGTFPSGSLSGITVARLHQGMLITNTGMDALEWMFKEAGRGSRRGVFPEKEQEKVCFRGNFAEYTCFSESLDTRPLLAKNKRIYMSSKANAVISHKVLKHGIVPLPEWPDEVMK